MTSGNYTTSGSRLNTDSTVDYSYCVSGSTLTVTPTPTGFCPSPARSCSRRAGAAGRLHRSGGSGTGGTISSGGTTGSGGKLPAVRPAPAATTASGGTTGSGGARAATGSGGTTASGGTPARCARVARAARRHRRQLHRRRTGTAGSSAMTGSVRHLRSRQHPLRRGAQHGARSARLVQRKPLQGQARVGQHDQGHRRRQPGRPRRHGHARHVLHGNDLHDHHRLRPVRATATSSKPRPRTAPSAATRARRPRTRPRNR